MNAKEKAVAYIIHMINFIAKTFGNIQVTISGFTFDKTKINGTIARNTYQHYHEFAIAPTYYYYRIRQGKAFKVNNTMYAFIPNSIERTAFGIDKDHYVFMQVIEKTGAFYYRVCENDAAIARIKEVYGINKINMEDPA